MTIGDYTTAIAVDILAARAFLSLDSGWRLDCLVSRTVASKGSLVTRVATGQDDKIGKRIRKEIFEGWPVSLCGNRY